MKKLIKIAVIVVMTFSFVALLPAQSKMGAMGVNSSVLINPSSIVMIKGKVRAVMTEIPVSKLNMSRSPVAFIKVKVFDDVTKAEHTIQIAPGNFMTKMGLKINRDDIILIKAYKTPGSVDFKSIELTKDNRKFIFRDQFGRGLWREEIKNIKSPSFR
jgi:hypothetical protein